MGRRGWLAPSAAGATPLCRRMPHWPPRSSGSRPCSSSASCTMTGTSGCSGRHRLHMRAFCSGLTTAPAQGHGRAAETASSRPIPLTDSAHPGSPLPLPPCRLCEKTFCSLPLEPGHTPHQGSTRCAIQHPPAALYSTHLLRQTALTRCAIQLGQDPQRRVGLVAQLPRRVKQRHVLQRRCAAGRAVWAGGASGWVGGWVGGWDSLHIACSSSARAPAHSTGCTGTCSKVLPDPAAGART